MERRKGKGSCVAPTVERKLPVAAVFSVTCDLTCVLRRFKHPRQHLEKARVSSLMPRTGCRENPWKRNELGDRSHGSHASGGCAPPDEELMPFRWQNLS